jgi:hypothetical protein
MMEQQPKNMVISTELAQAIYNYLDTCPHGRVRILVDGLLNLTTVDDYINKINKLESKDIITKKDES